MREGGKAAAGGCSEVGVLRIPTLLLPVLQRRRTNNWNNKKKR